MHTRAAVTIGIKPACLDAVEKPARVSEYFGCNTFSDANMKKAISEKTYRSFKRWQDGGSVITEAEADEIANAMKDWAVAKGATSYTHWFQPMTGQTAEKHDSFISIKGPGKVMEKFSGAKLIQGEPDASSFPSGGLRATFEARGYTAWDPSSPAFITEVERGKTLCIPSIFISYTGEALDKKLPLLRSDAALNAAARELLALFGRKSGAVFSTCGPEQEYFLIDEKYYRMRPDLQLAGRTLAGAPSPKGQQLEDQYFGSIKDRVLNFMHEMAEEAYKLGIPVTTRHNEVAPHQYEVAPVFERSNIAADHNILLMDIMKKIALKHGLVCLLHEKPFAGINGSGKHLNWSMADDKGVNYLNPGETPEENLLFLTILVAVIAAVHRNAALLRAAVASAGNEHRLGANEAPPAIVSIFLGEQLSRIVEQIESGKLLKAKRQDIIDLGVSLLPKFAKDATDRNRTSTFAFTGNKFEFRAVGSAMNISTSITVLNTIIADSLSDMAGQIKEALKSDDFNAAVMKVLRDTIKAHKAVLFEGNNYADEWVQEAARRGLPNIASSAEALKAFIAPAAIALFEKHGVFSKVELTARYTIWLDIYEKIIDIEARTLAEMVNTLIVPSALRFQNEVLASLASMRSLAADVKELISAEALEDRTKLAATLTANISHVRRNTAKLQEMLQHAHAMDLEKKTAYCFAEIKPQLAHIRKHVDELEMVMADDLWPLPKYREMLFIC